MMRIVILFMLTLLAACGGTPNKAAPIAPCGGGGVYSVPIVRECAAAAIAEATFLNYTKHKVAQYSVYPMQHTSTHWSFMIQGWVDEPKQPLPGYNWMVTVEKATGKADLTPGA
jgi:hypothetical protein